LSLDFRRRNEHHRQGKTRGVIVQFGGQTPLNLPASSTTPGRRLSAPAWSRSNARATGASFSRWSTSWGSTSRKTAWPNRRRKACQIAASIGLSCAHAPSFVLGGRAMHIVHDEEELLSFIEEAQSVGETGRAHR